MSSNLQKYLTGLLTITLAWFGARSFWRGVSRPSFFMGMIIVGFILFNYGPVTNVITNLYADHKQEQKEKLEREDKLRQEEKAEREALAKQKQIEISNVALKKIAEQTSAILAIKDNCIKHGFPATSCIKSANLELEKNNFSYRVPTTDPNAPDIATWMLQEKEKKAVEQEKKKKADAAANLAAAKQKEEQPEKTTKIKCPTMDATWNGSSWECPKNYLNQLKANLNKAIAACRATGTYYGPDMCIGPASKAYDEANKAYAQALLK